MCYTVNVYIYIIKCIVLRVVFLVMRKPMFVDAKNNFLVKHCCGRFVIDSLPIVSIETLTFSEKPSREESYGEGVG